MKTNSILMALMTMLWLQACEKPVEPESPARPALVMVVGDDANVDRADMVLVGEIKPRYESNQSFRVEGKIVARRVDVGDVVKKGQLLASIDATDIQLSAQVANADVLAAQARYTLAKAEVERKRKLVEQAFISQSALDADEAQLKTTLAVMQQAIAQAAVANNQSQYTMLRADRDGVITMINAEPGQVVKVGESVVQVVDLKQVDALVAVPESRIDNIQIGDRVTIQLWANQTKQYKGKVREITPTANEATRAFDMRVEIIDADEQMKFGMTAGVIVDRHAPHQLIVPTSAVTQQDGKTIVWVIDAQQLAQRRQVEVGPFTENGVEVLSGLSVGEMVAIAGVHTLVQGQQVKPKIQQNEHK
jgi:membrane fusion protein, multidrug efflux system